MIVLISHASKAMLKILQARLQQYINRELPDVQAGFRKCRGTRDQLANIYWNEVKSLSRVRLFATPWTVAYQASLSIGFSRQKCWSGLPFPSPGDLPDPGLEPRSPTLQVDSLLTGPSGTPWRWHGQFKNTAEIENELGEKLGAELTIYSSQWGEEWNIMSI